jgi:hypothetical protein
LNPGSTAEPGDPPLVVELQKALSAGMASGHHRDRVLDAFARDAIRSFRMEASRSAVQGDGLTHEEIRELFGKPWPETRMEIELSQPRWAEHLEPFRPFCLRPA